MSQTIQQIQDEALTLPLTPEQQRRADDARNEEIMAARQQQEAHQAWLGHSETKALIIYLVACINQLTMKAERDSIGGTNPAPVLQVSYAYRTILDKISIGEFNQ